MKHKMNLHSEPFDLIQSGYKTIELRLNDEKRSMIHCGDIIEFTNTSNPNKKIEVKVLKIHHFASFEELYESLPLDKCGYKLSKNSTAKASDMLMYYPREKQDRYGVLGIEILYYK